MSLWDISNKLDEVSYRLSSIRDVAEIIAERVSTDPESGAIWAVSEMIEVMENRLDILSSELMEMHRAEQEANKPKPTKKGTKK